MQVRGRVVGIAVLTAVLGACALAPAMERARGADAARRLDQLARADARVGQIGFRLSVANVELCPVHAPLVGWTLHNLDQYSGEMRPLVQARFGLDERHPGIVAVAAGSPAAEAGLQAGDLLVAIDGRSLDIDAGAPTTESYARLDGQIAVLETAMGRDRVQVDYRRQGVVRSAMLRPVSGCGYPFQVNAVQSTGALADGRRVYADHGLTLVLSDDDSLAFVLGHELSHNILRHRDQFDRIGVARGVLGNYGVAPSVVAAAERDADRWGVYLAARAGYQIGGLPNALMLLAEFDLGVRLGSWGHPPAGRRSRDLDRFVREVQARSSRGERLTP